MNITSKQFRAALTKYAKTMPRKLKVRLSWDDVKNWDWDDLSYYTYEDLNTVYGMSPDEIAHQIEYSRDVIVKSSTISKLLDKLESKKERYNPRTIRHRKNPVSKNSSMKKIVPIALIIGIAYLIIKNK